MVSMRRCNPPIFPRQGVFSRRTGSDSGARHTNSGKSGFVSGGLARCKKQCQQTAHLLAVLFFGFFTRREGEEKISPTPYRHPWSLANAQARQGKTWTWSVLASSSSSFSPLKKSGAAADQLDSRGCRWPGDIVFLRSGLHPSYIFALSSFNSSSLLLPLLLSSPPTSSSFAPRHFTPREQSCGTIR